MNEKTPRKTPLYEMELALGGTMVNFEDWLMAVKFEHELKEHTWTREHAGIFNICHMTEFMVEGPDAVPFLKHLMSNSIGIGDFAAQYQHMCYPSDQGAGVVDDLYIYRENAEKFRIIANAQTYETEGKDFNWLNDHIGDFQVKVKELSLQRARFAFQGPETMSLLNPITSENISLLKRFRWTYTDLTTKEGQIPIFCSRTGYTGEDDWSPELASFEISCETRYAEIVYQTFLDTGAKPIGLAARDSLRMECCYALYGQEINSEITTIEANAGWVVKEKEGHPFIGQEILLKQKKEGTSRISVGLNFVEGVKGVMRTGYKVLNNGEEIGYITSGTFAPTLNKPIGIALIDVKFKAMGSELEVQIRSKRKKVVVVKTPFYSRGKKT
jgi:aminomethyltransferase